MNQSNNKPSLDLPLEGLVVLDFSQFLAGPSCALRLADLGARVIKVERPQGGDLCRQLVVADQRFGEDSALFHTINRNKQSFAADLKDPHSLQQVKALIQQADVMIHNFRPGVMERIGLDSKTVLELNPRIVYGEITGYGDAGPWKDKPGQDLLVQSLSGIAWLSGNANQGPVPMGISVVDQITGAHLTQGILAALLRRERSNQGGVVTVSLLESAMDLQFEPFTAFLNSEQAQPTRSSVNHANVHTAAPYGIYQTADGYMALAMAPLDQLAQLLDHKELGERCTDHNTWYSDRDTYKALLRDHLITQPTAYWLARLEPSGIWCAPVYDWPTLIQHEGFQTLNAIQVIHHADGTSMQTTRCPIRLDGQTLTSPSAGPQLGADNDDILASLKELPNG
ncbi:MAG TPA: CaiB/BaiF CoA-transferase family protein [Paenalcaligenes sp.]|nr:CaiB/BaiF CoA-transferase family protein [Paenalcaligenes sp.]